MSGRSAVDMSGRPGDDGHEEDTMVQRIKVTPELRDRAWKDYYERHRRVLTLTEGQRKHIARVTASRRTGSAAPQTS